jgi:hypothetical protein
MDEIQSDSDVKAGEVLCHKCGARISMSIARLALWGHPAECKLIGKRCKASVIYEKETDCAAYDIHHNSEYKASKVPKKLFDQALQASGVPSTIFLSKNPSDKSLVVELRSIVKQKMSGFNRRNSSKS